MQSNHSFYTVHFAHTILANATYREKRRATFPTSASGKLRRIVASFLEQQLLAGLSGTRARAYSFGGVGDA